MRIAESQLRRIISEEIESGHNDRVIVTLGNTSTGPVYVIAYDPGELERDVDRARDGIDFGFTDYHGVIAGVAFKRSGEYGDCNGSWHVTSSVSQEKGWGTRVYLAALDLLRNISSDRVSVTASAEGMWKKLARYGFVEREEFDNIKNPQTPPESDDCRVFPARDQSLNSSWRIRGGIPSDVKSLVDGGEYHFRELGREGKREEAENLLRHGFGDLFVNAYDT
jgi:hypothetical protein